MKLKEKLAKEYALKILKEDGPGDPINIAHDWLQGFEKAQEMAGQKFETLFSDDHVKISLTDFYQLGEEEVE